MATTYASQGNSGYLGTFSLGSPLTDMVEVTRINFPRYSVPDLNRTHLLSPDTTEEYTPGLLNPGTVEMSGNFIGTADQTSTLDALAKAQTVFPWQFTMQVQNRSKTCTVSGNGYLNKHDIGPVEGNRTIEYSLSVRTTGFSSIHVA